MNLEEGFVLGIDKPYGWTSSDVVRKVKFILQHKFGKKNIKVGHAGTLDPLATGVLVVCIGKATKKAEALQAEEKEYIAEIKFGETTPCFDLEKEVDATYPYEHITQESIQATLPSFLGEIDQIPPVFSAKMIGGKRAYEFARKGQEVEMKPARIIISDLEILSFNSPIVTLRIRCSKGTYIRSLARDLSVELQSGAHLVGLKRTRSGSIRVESCFSMEEVEKVLKS
ncbi:MAG: tRNA pseudouridine(55) synthase TruB [Prevotellaceae bacterium]|nr:tRNA pseudouridine(55) synthase TruB [Prevotellaceae bacterium]